MVPGPFNVGKEPESDASRCMRGAQQALLNAPNFSQNNFPQMKPLQVLSPFDLKNKDTSEFSEHILKEMVLFLSFHERPMNSFGVQIQPGRIELHLSPEYCFVTETAHRFFFFLI